MANPVVIEDEMADELVYKPAQNVIRVKHLLNYTNGTFYPMKGMTPGAIPDGYATLHPKDDHITGFFNFVKVCEISFAVRFHGLLNNFVQGSLPGVPLRFEPGTNCKQSIVHYRFSYMAAVLNILDISFLWLELRYPRIPGRESYWSASGGILVGFFLFVPHEHR